MLSQAIRILGYHIIKNFLVGVLDSYLCAVKAKTQILAGWLKNGLEEKKKRKIKTKPFFLNHFLPN